MASSFSLSSKLSYPVVVDAPHILQGPSIRIAVFSDEDFGIVVLFLDPIQKPPHALWNHLDEKGC